MAVKLMYQITVFSSDVLSTDLSVNGNEFLYPKRGVLIYLVYSKPFVL